MNSLLSELLQWLQNNAYRLASFDRIIGIVSSASTYEQLEELVDSYPEIFRHSNIKGGLPGLALRDGVNTASELEKLKAEEEQEQPLIVAAPPVINSSEIESEVEYEYYRNLGSALKVPDGPAGNVTLCVLILRNGFVIVGKSACVHRENFNEEVGQRLAREDAIRQIGPFMGWREADKRLAL